MSELEARPVTLTLAAARQLTVLEVARACALAGVRRSEVDGLLRSLVDPNALPELVERGTTLLYAIAFELALRTEAVSWDEAQHWALTLDLEAVDDQAEAEAEAVVEASIATGLPPAVAGELTMSQLDAYRVASERRAAERGA